MNLRWRLIIADTPLLAACFVIGYFANGNMLQQDYVRIMIVAILCTGLWVSRLLINYCLHPLHGLADTARHIGNGALQTRAMVQGSDEISALAHELNLMAQRLADYQASTLGELITSKEAQQAAIDAIPDAIFVIDKTYHMIMYNQAAAKFAINHDEFNYLQDIRDPYVRKIIEDIVQHTLPKNLQHAFIYEQYAFLPYSKPVYNESGALRFVVVILQDVTSLRLADKLKTDLITTVTDAFKEPLKQFRMALHACLQQDNPLSLSHTQITLLYNARDEAEALQSVVDNLSHLSSLQTMTPQEQDPS